MKITNNKLEGVPFIQSPNGGSAITPKFIVMHYTAGYTGKSAIDTFKNPASKVSAHLVIDLDGSITQMMPFNKSAWHAGPSKHDGYTNLNSHSIGIEIVNIGYLKKLSDGWYQDAYGNKRAASVWPYGFIEAKHPRVGSGTYYWPIYTPQQMETLNKLVPVLIKAYGIKDIVSHEEIDTRKWKSDPGPAMDLNHFKKMLYGRDDESAEDTLALDKFKVNTLSLNIRGGAGTNYPVIGTLKQGDQVERVDKVGDWAYVNYTESGTCKQGWVHSYYLKAA